MEDELDESCGGSSLVVVVSVLTNCSGRLSGLVAAAAAAWLIGTKPGSGEPSSGSVIPSFRNNT